MNAMAEPDRIVAPGLAAGARSLAAALPDLMVAARDVANTVASGWHGRRRAGTGEDFWQFRPFQFGEPARSIDWRRSARDDHLYFREQEMENAHTVWLWTDLSASMDFRPRLASTTKRDRSLVLMIALAELLARSGERIGLLGRGRPIASRNAAERLAMSLAAVEDLSARPSVGAVRRFHEVVIFGDFLDPADATAADLDHLAGAGARAHLVQVMDPVEETFPFAGRTEFRDPETGERITAGRAEAWRTGYLEALAEQRARLRAATRLPGWSFLVHHTDRSPTEVLLALHARLAASTGMSAGPGAGAAAAGIGAGGR
jgi:uncharacterized protein (DUF58 family)